ncbi:hypothetical protein PACILC2_52750 [Paenibacillus cisolokensis]|uniref:Uncharacterized protein n=1 Tax=Paenibacillus cisolokensis TaxID=1658519 RepID=A0ABQ4NEQ4_9BACL|nr:hypothetical protein [Paenibacillus cisolokensis]GIQ66707.1 hypothetical protein PACILC2_52750 [Paenibacillus cisolokensis]
MFNEETNKSIEELARCVKIIYDDYSLISTLDIDLSLVAVKNMPADEDLSFFENVGYPIPQEDEINSSFKYNYAATVSLLLQGLFKDNKFLFPEYYYFMGNGMLDDKHKSYLKLFLNKTIELTENDKYNEARIKAQKILDSLN